MVNLAKVIIPEENTNLMDSSYWLAIDDTDSAKGGCTTYTMAKIIDTLHEEDQSFKPIGFPRLIRLNPNVPFKTRGNGAVAIHFQSSMNLNQIFEFARPIVEGQSRPTDEDAFPTLLVVKYDKPISKELYIPSLQRVISPDQIEIDQQNCLVWPNWTQRSLVGAYCSIIADLSKDFTFELLAYRRPENCGRHRLLDKVQVKKLAIEYQNETFSSYDFVLDRELIAPAGPDPVFCGIRGENPIVVRDFFDKLIIDEPLEGYMIVISNQGTGHHLSRPNDSMEPHSVFSSMVVITSPPSIFQGGHVKVLARRRTTTITLMFFEPTKTLAKHAQLLAPGDVVYIGGAVKLVNNEISISVEEMIFIEKDKMRKFAPPFCSDCSRKMTSAGTFKGYKCKSCGQKRLKGIEIEQERLTPPPHKRLLPVLSAQRHLTKPQNREGREKFLSTDLDMDEIDYQNFRARF